jgi:hypothetical protein
MVQVGASANPCSLFSYYRKTKAAAMAHSYSSSTFPVFRRNEVAVFAFLAPMLLLMKIPIVGPLLFLPVCYHCYHCCVHGAMHDARWTLQASAAAAYLADLLHRQPANASFIAGLLHHAQAVATLSSRQTA